LAVLFRFDRMFHVKRFRIDVSRETPCTTLCYSATFRTDFWGA
jgi:hypothetical protein